MRANTSAVVKPSWLGSIVLHVLGMILSILFFLVIVLLPLTTSVPAWVWIPLAVADLLLIILQFRLKPAGRGVGVGVAGVILVTVIAIVASQVFAATPAILGEDGRLLPGSIATLEKVNLNGSEQWITIRGRDASKPILLNLGMGGPGGGGFATRSLFEPLEQYFVVVSWDEPGTGKSYSAVQISALTPERFVEDAHALTLYMLQRFHQDKLYVYGVSWTSMLGIWLVQKYPDQYYPYVGSGQMVNTTENDRMGYALAAMARRPTPALTCSPRTVPIWTF